MKRALLLAALAVVAVLPATAAAADEGQLVVSGHGGSTGELVLSSALRLSPESGALIGGDGYAGVLLEPVGTTTPALGLLQVRAFRDGTQVALARLGAATELPAGRYRVTVLGQGRVSARFPLSDADAPAVRAVATRRIPVQFLGRAEDVLDGRSRAGVVFQRAVPAGRRALIATLMRGLRVDDLRSCVTTAATCPAGRPSVGTDDTPVLAATLVGAATGVRNAVFSADGYRQVADDLRAVAIVF